MTSLKIRNLNPRIRKVKRSIQRRLPDSVTDLPTSVQKSYFMLADAERAVLNTALEKYRLGQSEPIYVGGGNVLKPALRLKRGENEEVYLTFTPSLERIWLESKKRLLKFGDKKPANIGLRSQYALRLYDWAKKYASVGSTHMTLEQLRTVLGLESVRDAAGNIIREAPLAVWAPDGHSSSLEEV